MRFGEHKIEAGKPIQAASPGFVDNDTFQSIHQKAIICCHDVAIAYPNAQGEYGIVTVIRDNIPNKNERWVLGGKVERGMDTEESLCQRVKGECGLDLSELEFLGAGRTMSGTDPFGHGDGTDTINLVYFGLGEGDLVLDKLHSAPEIVTPGMYTPEFQEGLYPYTKLILDATVPMLSRYN